MAMNQLAIYNTALQALGERSLDSTAENRKTRRELDKVWASGGSAINYALEQGHWNFAKTRASIASSSGGTASFQYAAACPLPTDFVRLVSISSSTDMKDPLIDYQIEGGYVQSNSTVLYIQYISDSTVYGNNMSIWPETFARWFGHFLATQVYPTVENPKTSIEVLQAKTDRLLVNARQKSYADGPEPFPERKITTIDHRALDFAVELLPFLPREQQ